MSTLDKTNYICPVCSTHLMKGNYEKGTCPFGHKLELDGKPMNNPVIIEGVKDCYEDEIVEHIHAGHEICNIGYNGECLDSGGAVGSDDYAGFPEEFNEAVIEFYEEDKETYNKEYEEENK